MHTTLFDVHPQTDSRTLLRQMDATRHIQAQRELSKAEIESFIAQVKKDYATAFNLLDTPKLKALGQRLYAWLDGPSQRWLADWRNQYPHGWALHIDVEAKLRHLPWELLHDGGQWLCGHAHQPFTPVRRVRDSGAQPSASHNPAETPNRPLRVLFMACSPRNVEPVLNYEHEEIAILAAASKHGIELVVEETGSLAGLAERLGDYDAGYFDVLHLTGHAALIDNKPVFLMEDDFGQRFEASPDHILRACSGRLPRLMFLSGCSTGKAADDANASLCEEMVRHGVSAALGWALPVYDHSASAAAAFLYEKLATGTRLDEAIARTRHMLLEDHPEMWHLLRLYADASPLTALVTAPKHKDRAVLPPTPDTATQLRDLGGKLEVCERKHFVGRRREVQASLRCLKALLGTSDYAEGVLLQGMGGMGKSSLVARLCDRLPDTQRLIWVGRVDWPAFVRGLSEAPDLSEALAKVELEQRKTPLKVRLRQLLRQPSLIAKPALFIFDDFEQNLTGHHPTAPNYRQDAHGHYAVEPDTIEIVAALMAAIRDENSRSRVIVTSRYQPALPPPARLRHVPLAAMPEADLGKKAEQLAQLRLARRHPDRKALYARALTLSAGNPRLLTHLNTAFERDDDGTLDLSALLHTLEATAAAFRETLLLCSLLGTLNDETRHTLAGLALFETPVPNAALAALLACPARASQAMLGSALASGLAEQHEMGGAEKDPRYFVNPLVAALLPAYPAQSADYARAATWLHKAWWQDRDSPQMDEALEVQRLALLGQIAEVIVELGASLSSALIKKYRYSEAATLCQRSLQVCSHYRIYMQLGRAKENLGDLDTAEQSYKQALQIYRQNSAEEEATGKTKSAIALRDYADIAVNYAGILKTQGNYDVALDSLKQSLAIRQQIDDKSGEGTTFNNISLIYSVRGDYDTALDFLKQSLAIRQQINDKSGEGITLNNISLIYSARGDYDIALTYLKQSLAITQQSDDKSNQATILNNISLIYSTRGDYDTALDFLKQSLAIRQQIGDKSGEETTLNNISQIFMARGDYDTALDFLKQSLAIQQQIGDKSGEGTTLNNISQIYDARGDYDTALDFLKQPLAIRQQIGDKSGEGTTLNNISQIFKARGDYDTALDFLKQPLAIRQQIGDKSGEGTTLYNISQIYDARGDYDTALDFLKQSLAIRQQIGDKSGEGTTLNNMATTAHARGDYDTALDFLKQSLAIQQQIGDVAGLCATLFNMGHMHWQNDEQAEALQAWVRVYGLAQKLNLAQALEALTGLAQRLDLPGGLAGWEWVAAQLEGRANGG